MISLSAFADLNVAQKLVACELTLDACDTYANAQHKVIKAQEEKLMLMSKHLEAARSNEALLPWYVYVGGGILLGFAGGAILSR